MQNQRSVEVAVGFFIVLGVLGLLFMALQSANLSSFSFGAKSYEVTASFDNVGNLKPRAAVRSAGVVVGRVKSVAFDKDNFTAIVTMDIDSRYPFPADTSAQILTSGLIGEQYVGLEAGADEKNLANGSRIRRTQSAVVLEKLISQFLYSKAGESAKASN